jgi:DNA-binding response OmpR family regulator
MSNIAHVNLEPTAHKEGAECPSGNADTEGATCDLLMFVLPEGQGLDVWKEIQCDQALSDLPVAILTVQSEEIVRILDCSKGNNYLKKLGRAESVPEVKNLLHGLQFSEMLNRQVEVAKLVIDPFSYRVTCEGKQTNLTVLEFRLLYYLATRPNRFFTRNQLYAAIWSGSRSINPRVVDVYIRRLRMKIEVEPENPVYLKTLRGMGYLFDSASRKLAV